MFGSLFISSRCPWTSWLCFLPSEEALISFSLVRRCFPFPSFSLSLSLILLLPFSLHPSFFLSVSTLSLPMRLRGWKKVYYYPEWCLSSASKAVCSGFTGRKGGIWGKGRVNHLLLKSAEGNRELCPRNKCLQAASEEGKVWERTHFLSLRLWNFRKHFEASSHLSFITYLFA